MLKSILIIIILLDKNRTRMASRAAINFAKMYGVDLARKMGFLVQDHHLLTAADGAGESELEAFALIVGQNAAYFNKGMMS